MSRSVYRYNVSLCNLWVSLTVSVVSVKRQEVTETAKSVTETSRTYRNFTMAVLYLYIYPIDSNFFCRHLQAMNKFDLLYQELLYNLKKVKVSHSLITIGAVWGRVPRYLGHSKLRAEPIPLLSLPYPSLIQKNLPIFCRVDRESFQLVTLGSPASNLTTLHRLPSP